MTAGCGGVGGENRQPGYSESAAEIYRIGNELGARDALSGATNDHTRHLNSFDSPFMAQFESGYREGYSRYSR